MRWQGAPSEIGRLASPLLRVLDGAWRRMHWWVAALALLYGASGITVISPDEVAVVLRWGRLVGDSAATQQHGPGLLFAFPRPMDEVVRVKTKHVDQQPIDTLAYSGDWSVNLQTLDPLVGYALTGDQNVVKVAMMASYRVQDPVDRAFYGPAVESILVTEVSAAMVRSLGEMSIDRALADGRKELIATASRRAQAGLDAAHSGLLLVSLELLDLAPPRALASEFEAVQSAFIQAETDKKNAQAVAQEVIPRANATANTTLQAARAGTDGAKARAQGETAAFLALEREYRANPAVVRERMYRDAVEKAIAGARDVRWIPPPAGSRYQGTRVLVEAGRTRSAMPPSGEGRP